MPITAPPTITALPTPPDPGDRGTFNARAYPWSVALTPWATQVSAVATNVYDNATEASTAATAAAAQASAAVSAVNAVQWVSGTNYAAGSTAWSPLTLQSYRTGTAGVSNTDPSLDTARWTTVSGGGSLPHFLLLNAGII